MNKSRFVKFMKNEKRIGKGIGSEDHNLVSDLDFLTNWTNLERLH